MPTTCKRGNQHFLSFPGQHELNLRGSLAPPLSSAATEPSACLFGSQTEASLGDSSLCQTCRSGLCSPVGHSDLSVQLVSEGRAEIQSSTQAPNPAGWAEVSALRPSHPVERAEKPRPAFPCAAQPSKTGQAKQFNRWG